MYRRYCTLPIVLIVLLLWVLSNAQDTVRVKRVVDRDTLLLVNGEKVRVSGIDAPESKPNPGAEKQVEMQGKDLKTTISMGKESTKFVRSLEPGDQVRIEFDVEKRDQYGRLLGYVIFLIEGCLMRR